MNKNDLTAKLHQKMFAKQNEAVKTSYLRCFFAIKELIASYKRERSELITVANYDPFAHKLPYPSYSVFALTLGKDLDGIFYIEMIPGGSSDCRLLCHLMRVFLKLTASPSVADRVFIEPEKLPIAPMSKFNVFEVEVDFLTELECDDFNLNESFITARQLEADQLGTISIIA